jgi:hypothetical protein
LALHPSDHVTSDDREHLFIVGLPRTGSTLLRHVLNRSDEVAVLPETHFMARSRQMRLAARVASVEGDTPAADRLAKELCSPRFWPWLARNVSPSTVAARLRSDVRAERDVLALLMELYAEEVAKQAPAPRFVGEKTPAHLDDVMTLAAWFPGATFIHTVRDPRAAYASRLQRVLEGRWGVKARLPWLPARLVDPLLPFFEVVHTARAWRRAAVLDERYARALGARYLRVRFEDLVTAPQRTIRLVCATLGVAYADDLLAATDVVGSSFSTTRHAGSGFDASIAQRWRSQVGPLPRRLLGAAAGRHLARLGYSA